MNENYIIAEYLPTQYNESTGNYIYEIYPASKYLFDTDQIAGVYQIHDDGSEEKLETSEDSPIPSEFQDKPYMMTRVNIKDSELKLKILFTDYPSSLKGMFRNCIMLTSVDLSHCDTKYVSTMNTMFHNNRNIEYIDLSVCDTSNVADVSFLFSVDSDIAENEPSKIKHINLSNCDFRGVETVKSMFMNDFYLEELEIEGIKTSNSLIDCHNMFSSCFSLREFNLEWLNTSNVNDITGMFGTSFVVGNLSYELHDKRKLIRFGNYPILSLPKLVYGEVGNPFDGWSGIIQYPNGRDYSNIINFLKETNEKNNTSWVFISYETPVDSTTKFLDLNGLAYNNKKIKEYINNNSPKTSTTESYSFKGYQQWTVGNYGEYNETWQFFNQEPSPNYITYDLPVFMFTTSTSDKDDFNYLFLDPKTLNKKNWGKTKFSILVKKESSTILNNEITLSIVRPQKFGPEEDIYTGEMNAPCPWFVEFEELASASMGYINSYDDYQKLECTINVDSAAVNDDYLIQIGIEEKSSIGRYKITPLKIEFIEE